jgi:hypothetical protein
VTRQSRQIAVSPSRTTSPNLDSARYVESDPASQFHRSRTPMEASFVPSALRSL